MQSMNLTNHFLIAMPAMDDPYFSRSLIYIAEHNDQGALGLIVNRPIELNLAALFEKIDVPLEAHDVGKLPVYFGGPVQTDRGFVLHRPLGNWQSTLAVTPELGLTSSRDVLQALGQEGEPGEIIVALGYSGWGAGRSACPFRVALRGATAVGDGNAWRRFCQPVGNGRACLTRLFASPAPYWPSISG